MKLTEFKKLIREEVRKVIKEAYNIPTQVTGAEFVEAVKNLLPDIRQRIDKAAKSVKVTYVEDDYETKQHPAGNELKVVYVGIKDANKLANGYNRILSDLDLLSSSGKGSNANIEQRIRVELSKMQ